MKNCGTNKKVLLYINEDTDSACCLFSNSIPSGCDYCLIWLFVITERLFEQPNQKHILFMSLAITLPGTPNRQALERFGTLGPDGIRRPFHVYHLGKAVSEGSLVAKLSQLMSASQTVLAFWL